MHRLSSIKNQYPSLKASSSLVLKRPNIQFVSEEIHFWIKLTDQERDHSLCTYAKFSENLTFFKSIRVKNVRFLKTFAYIICKICVHSTCIDLILTNAPQKFQSTCVLETGLPDFHSMKVTAMRKIFKKLKPRTTNYRSYKHFSNEA